jgi:hypothetical protein
MPQIHRKHRLSRATSRRNFMAGGLAAAGGTLAAGALSMTGSSALGIRGGARGGAIPEDS